MLCPQHFVGGNGPTHRHPDPIPVDGSKPFTFVEEEDSEQNCVYMVAYPTKSQVPAQNNAW